MQKPVTYIQGSCSFSKMQHMFSVQRHKKAQDFIFFCLTAPFLFNNVCHSFHLGMTLSFAYQANTQRWILTLPLSEAQIFLNFLLPYLNYCTKYRFFFSSAVSFAKLFKVFTWKRLFNILVILCKILHPTSSSFIKKQLNDSRIQI